MTIRYCDTGDSLFAPCQVGYSSLEEYDGILTCTTCRDKPQQFCNNLIDLYKVCKKMTDKGNSNDARRTK